MQSTTAHRMLFTASIVVLAMIASLATAGTSTSARATLEPVRAAVVELSPTEGSAVEGTVTLIQRDDAVSITGRVTGLAPGPHGFHIHEFGDLRAPDGKSAGGHFAPRGSEHGGPDDPSHHAGDLGNIVADADGAATVDKTTRAFDIGDVLGRSIVVHAGRDDLESQPSGDAGARRAVGIIGVAGPDVVSRR